MNNLYRVVSWGRDHENNRSRELEQPRYTLMPNKQDGMGLTAILAEKDGLSIYGVWCLLVGMLSKQRRPRAGWLTEDGTESGTPLRFSRMALRWRCTEKEVKRAVEFLASDQVGWLEVTNTSHDVGTKSQAAATQPATERSGAERKGEDKYSVKARSVFDHWCSVMDKPAQTKFPADSRRYRNVVARLKEGFTVEQLCAAVDGCRATPHNMGQNERQTMYNDLELICRTVENVERFSAKATQPQVQQPAHVEAHGPIPGAKETMEGIYRGRGIDKCKAAGVVWDDFSDSRLIAIGKGVDAP